MLPGCISPICQQSADQQLVAVPGSNMQRCVTVHINTVHLCAWEQEGNRHKKNHLILCSLSSLVTVLIMHYNGLLLTFCVVICIPHILPFTHFTILDKNLGAGEASVHSSDMQRTFAFFVLFEMEYKEDILKKVVHLILRPMQNYVSSCSSPPHRRRHRC